MANRPQRQRFDVQPAKQKSGWDVVREGGGQVVSHHRTKDLAVDAAVREARRAPLGEVRIKREDGTIQDERTYGKDPYPPKG